MNIHPECASRHDVSNSGPRSGFALPVAILALVIVGVLVTGGFFLANQETRIGQSTERGTMAFYLAETGIGEVAQDWDNARFQALELWESFSESQEVGNGEWEVEVTRIGDQLALMQGEGRITRGGNLAGAARRIAMVTRTLSLNLEVGAGLTTQGNVDLVGSAEISGLDQDPGGWGEVCPGEGAHEDTPGVKTTPGSSVTTSGGAVVEGDPEYGDPNVDYDDSIDDETFTEFGDLHWDDLVGMANHSIPGGTINNTEPLVQDGECVTSHEYNWGDPLDPTSPCGSYFPVIHIQGDANIQSAGYGQGILLVEGDIRLQGAFEFNGIIIAQGTAETYGGGPRVNGGVMAANATLENDNTFGGSSQIQYSSCAVQRTLLHANNIIRVRPIAERNWVDLSAITF